MRIANHENLVQLDRVTLFLTDREMKEMIGYLVDLIGKNDDSHHHVSSENYDREITITRFDPENAGFLDEFSREIVLGP